MGKYSPIIGVQVNIFQYSSGIGMFDDTVGFFLGSELVMYLGGLLDYYHGGPVGLQFILDIPRGSKVKYPNSFGSPLQATIVVTPAGSGVKFISYLYGICLTYTSQATHAVSLSGGYLLYLGVMDVVGSSAIPKAIINYKLK